MMTPHTLPSWLPPATWIASTILGIWSAISAINAVTYSRIAGFLSDYSRSASMPYSQADALLAEALRFSDASQHSVKVMVFTVFWFVVSRSFHRFVRDYRKAQLDTLAVNPQ